MVLGFGFERGAGGGGGGGVNAENVITGERVLYALGDSITAQTTGRIEPTSGGYITEITNANPAVVTYAGHGLETGDVIYIWGIPTTLSGMASLNETLQTVTVIDASTFSLNGVDATTWGDYTSSMQGQMMPAYIVNGSTDQKFSYGTGSWLGAAQKFCGQRFKFFPHHNRGISAETTQSMVGRLSASLPVGKGITDVMFMAGTNDVNTSTPIATTQTNMTTIKNHIINTLGAKMIWGTIPPWDAHSAAQKDTKDALNEWIRAQAAADPTNITLVEFYNNVANLSTRSYLSGYASDGIHPNPKGATAMGKAMADAIIPRYGVGQYSLKAGNKLLNPTMTGTGGSASGGAGSWTNPTQIATSWTGNIYGSGGAAVRTLSKGAVAGFGSDCQILDLNYQTLEATQNGAGFSQTVTGGFTDGAFYVAEGLLLFQNFVQLDPLAIPIDISLGVSCGATLLAKDGGVLTGTPASDLFGNVWDTVSGQRALGNAKGLIFKTPPVRYLSSLSTNMKVEFLFRVKVDTNTGISFRVIPLSVQLYEVPNPYL